MSRGFRASTFVLSFLLISAVLIPLPLALSCATGRDAEKLHAEEGSGQQTGAQESDAAAEAGKNAAGSGTASGAAETGAASMPSNGASGGNGVSAGIEDSTLPAAPVAGAGTEASAGAQARDHLPQNVKKPGSAPLPPPLTVNKTISFHTELFETRQLASGASLSIYRLSNRPFAAIDICLSGQCGPLDAIGLIMAAQQAQPAGKGAELSLSVLSGGTLCLELNAPAQQLPETASELVKAITLQTFFNDSGNAAKQLSAEDRFASALRFLELSALKRETDPGELLTAHSLGLIQDTETASPLGTTASLYGLSLADTARSWKESPRASRLFFAAAGSINCDELAKALNEALGSTAAAGKRPASAPAIIPAGKSGTGKAPAARPASSSPQKPIESSILPWTPGFALTLIVPSASGKPAIHTALSVPAAADPERADLILALSIIGDEFARSLPGAVFSFSFDQAAPQSCFITISSVSDPAAAKLLFESTVRRFKYGSLAEGNPELISDTAFAAAKSRAITRIYNCDGSCAALARLIALDVLSGGSFSFFRLGAAIQNSSRPRVEQAALSRLDESSLRWLLSERGTDR